MSTIIPPPMTPTPPRRRWYQLPATVLRNLFWVFFALLASGCGGAALAAERAQVQSSADTCDGRALAIIEAAETCEGAVRGLNALVKKDPACQNVFHARDPATSCQDVGTQPRVRQ